MRGAGSSGPALLGAHVGLAPGRARGGPVLTLLRSPAAGPGLGGGPPPFLPAVPLELTAAEL